MIKTITKENFRRYGWIIEYPKKHLKGNVRNLWRIVLTESKPLGWRIAYLIVRDQRLKRLECHPESYESFEPVRGKAILFVSHRKDMKYIESFYLDKPVILKKEVWHGIIASGREAEIKLTENATVTCAYWPLGFHLSRKGKNVQHP